MDKARLVEDILSQLSIPFHWWYIQDTPTHAALVYNWDYVDNSLMDDEFLMYISYDGVSH